MWDVEKEARDNARRDFERQYPLAAADIRADERAKTEAEIVAYLRAHDAGTDMGVALAAERIEAGMHHGWPVRMGT